MVRQVRTGSSPPANAVVQTPSARSSFEENDGSTPASRQAKRTLQKLNMRVRASMMVVKGATEAVTARKVSTTVASFLPTSLLRTLHSAVVDASVNPRLPCEQPGIFLCLSLSGLNSLPELPITLEECETQVQNVFRKIVLTVHNGGGEVLRMTGDMALAIWSLPEPGPALSTAPDGAKGSPASAFDPRHIRVAAEQASSCAQQLLKELHDHVLWADTSPESLAKLRSQRRAIISDTPRTDQGSSRDSPSPTSVSSERAKSLWGGVKSAARTMADQNPKVGFKKENKSGLTMIDAVKAASRAADEGLDFRLKVGASITVAVAQAMHVGGTNGRWEYVTCAPEVSAAHNVLTLSNPGDLLVAEPLWTFFRETDLQPHATLEEWKRLSMSRYHVPEENAPMLNERMDLLSSLPVATVKSYMPGAVWAKILAGDPYWIVGAGGKMRGVTVLMIRMLTPQNSPLLTQVAAYTAAISLFQVTLYKCTGTLKHVVQDQHGCTAVAVLGLPPFEHSEVGDSRGAVTAALEMRSELSNIGMMSHAVVVCGKTWVGSVGTEHQHEYVVLGQPLQLAKQMLEFTTDESPVLVDGPTSQANKTRFNFTKLSVTTRVPGQLKQHAMLAITESRDEGSTSTVYPVSFDVAQWMRLHNKHLHSNLVTGSISDASKQQMKEVFRELDSDRSGSISVKELLAAIQEIDGADANSRNSMRYIVELMVQDMDIDSETPGEIEINEFIAMAACANEASASAKFGQDVSVTQNLPLLLTALTTRKVLQRRLGDDFVENYYPEKLKQRTSKEESEDASKAAGVKGARRDSNVSAGRGQLSGRKTSMPIPGTPIDTSKWTREDRRRSVTHVLDEADMKAAEIMWMEEEREAGSFRRKAGALQNLSDETETIYAQYRAIRSKLGTVKDPSGRLDALLSPRKEIVSLKDPQFAQYGTSLRGLPVQGVGATFQPASGRLSSPASPTSPQRSPRRPSLRWSANTNMPTPDPIKIPDDGAAMPPDLVPSQPSFNWTPQPPTGSPPAVLRRGLGFKFHPLMLPEEGSTPGAERTPGQDSSFRSNALSMPNPSPSPRVTEISLFSVRPSPRIKSLAPSLIGHQRVEAFPGPAAEKPERKRKGPKRARAEAPPSSQLPMLFGSKPEGRAPVVEDSIAERWGESTRAKEETQKEEQGAQRDHHEHRQHKEASAWQRELRQRQRMRLRVAETKHAAQSAQLTRLNAYQCLRDIYQEGSPRIQQELELGEFGSVGLSIGSRPRTPADERAMQNWVVDNEQTSAGKSRQAVAARGGSFSRRASKEKMSDAEVRAWLQDPGVRTSFEDTLDILEFHGVLKEFEEAGALLETKTKPSALDLEAEVEAKAASGRASPVLSSSQCASPVLSSSQRASPSPTRSRGRSPPSRLSTSSQRSTSPTRRTPSPPVGNSRAASLSKAQ